MTNITKEKPAIASGGDLPVALKFGGLFNVLFAISKLYHANIDLCNMGVH
jgi:hypothetical protein